MIQSQIWSWTCPGLGPGLGVSQALALSWEFRPRLLISHSLTLISCSEIPRICKCLLLMPVCFFSRGQEATGLEMCLCQQD